ncbi:19667_t:CDS:2 [Rhizophagus irregularis]|nr:19667_t:CDS:2 [Rhizophagus irregularis]
MQVSPSDYYVIQITTLNNPNRIIGRIDEIQIAKADNGFWQDDLDNYDEFTHEILDITRSCVFEDVKANTESEVSVSSRLTIAPSQMYIVVDTESTIDEESNIEKIPIEANLQSWKKVIQKLT